MSRKKIARDDPEVFRTHKVIATIECSDTLCIFFKPVSICPFLNYLGGTCKLFNDRELDSAYFGHDYVFHRCPECLKNEITEGDSDV